MAKQWRGVLHEYADRLDVTEATPVITLGEGGTRSSPPRPSLRGRARRCGSSTRA